MTGAPVSGQDRTTASVVGACLASGAAVVVVGAGHAHHPTAVALALLLLPALAVWVPLPGVAPLARGVLALGWTVALTTLSAEAVLLVGWSVETGTLAVIGASALLWLGIESAHVLGAHRVRRRRRVAAARAWPSVR